MMPMKFLNYAFMHDLADAKQQYRIAVEDIETVLNRADPVTKPLGSNIHANIHARFNPLLIQGRPQNPGVLGC